MSTTVYVVIICLACISLGNGIAMIVIGKRIEKELEKDDPFGIQEERKNKQ